MKIVFKAKHSDLVMQNIAQTRALFKNKFNEEIVISSDRIYEELNKDHELVQMREMVIEEPGMNKRPGVVYLGTKKYEEGIPAVFSNGKFDKLHEESDRCDHCQQNRNRSVYHFFQEGEKLKMIGSNCALDYFGHDFTAMITRYWAFIQELNCYSDAMDKSDEEAGGRPRINTMGFMDVLRVSLHCIENFGYLSKSSAEETGRMSTSDVVREILWSNKTEKVQLRQAILSLEVNLEEYKTKLLAKCEKSEDLTTLEFNVRENLSIDVGGKRYLRQDISAHRLGLVVYTIYSVYRELHAPKQRWEKCISKHVSLVGAKIESLVSVEFTKPVSYSVRNQEKTGLFIKFRDHEGNILTWFSSRHDVDFAVNQECKIKCTIKDHDSYEDEQITKITRVKKVI